MGTRISIGAVALFACVLFSCGDDDDDVAKDCPGDAAAGTTVTCSCSGARTGTATCGADGRVSACDCDSDAGTAGTGGRSGSGGSSAGRGGSSTAGSGGSTPAQDSGATDPDEDGGSEPEPMTPVEPTLPMNGNQLSVCDSDRDCNMNLGCYNPDSGGFCSRVCEQDQDCADLPGAMYHCGQSGVCSVECENADDDASCPAGLECSQRADGGGGGGGPASFRCLYPETPAEPAGTPFSLCEGGGECMDGLQCLGDNMGQPGFCSHACTPENSDCSDVPAPSGTIAPTCVPQTPEQGVCALDCEAMPAGCPTGMQCVEQGFYMLCMFRE
jgi:hypothetical protein